MKICINGKFCDSNIATISVDDRGLLLGDGLFETVLAIDGKLIFFQQHYDRLRQSAQQLMIPLHDSYQQLHSSCLSLLTENQLNQTTAAIRITLTRGSSEQRGIGLPQTPHPTLIITANRYQVMPPPELRMMISRFQRNQHSPLTSLKTTNYLEFILCRAHAQRAGFDDGILLNTDGYLTESTTANLFFIDDNVVYTPSLDCGVLPGIVRTQIIELCKAQAIKVEQTQLAPDSIASMDLAFQTNSLVGIAPIHSIDNSHFSDWKNSVFKRIEAAYSEQLTG